jgi:hypothetical protein
MYSETENEEFSGHAEDARDGDFRIYEVEPLLKRKIWRTQLSGARYQTSIQDRKLFFGKPSSLLQLEHLAAKLSLVELRDIFDRCN